VLRYLICIAVLAACHAQKSPELHVLGARHEVVYVQVTNPANHPMRLDKLEYKFAADHGKTMVAQGELPLDAREVPAGAAVVVEVPLDVDASKPMTLTGTLTAELDEIVRSFQVSAQIQPH
jgi:LEA14-like dessication related protein